MKTVPAITPTERKLIEPGTHKGLILEFAEPRQSISREGIMILRIELVIKGQKLFCYEAGYINLVMMVYRARAHWIGREVRVHVKQRHYEGRIYNSGQIIWEEEKLDARD